MNNIYPSGHKKSVSETQRVPALPLIRRNNYKGPAERLMNGDLDSVVWTGGLAESWLFVLEAEHCDLALGEQHGAGWRGHFAASQPRHV